LRYHLGGGNVWIVPELSVQDGIQAARAMFPHAWIDETNCEQGVEALRQYQREWDDDKKAFREKPRHDWTSHCADAFRMLAVAWRQENIEVRKPPEDITRPLTLNERLSIHDRKYQKRSRI
jgi:phage terminase large subunit